MKKIKGVLNKDDIEIIRKKMAQLKPGILPLPIFLEVSRLCVLSTIEIVPNRLEKNNSLQVLLIKRKEDDSNWPDMFHAPGTVVRETDREGNFKDAIKRILTDELKNVKIEIGPIFVKPVFRNLGRGKEMTLMHWAIAKGSCPLGKYFNIDSLPGNVIKKQVKDIKMAVSHFKANYLKNKI
ncbi:MAG: hypothetical protein PHP21_03550 [Patescibacteria group bacterium]|nr:hypothetical protein [Patescibacteria group bacterium]